MENEDQTNKREDRKVDRTKDNLTELKERVNEDFLRMTPDALDALYDMMTEPNINPLARVQAIGLILDRGLGKPEESIRIQNDQESMEAAQERLNRLFALVKDEKEDEE